MQWFNGKNANLVRCQLSACELLERNVHVEFTQALSGIGVEIRQRLIEVLAQNDEPSNAPCSGTATIQRTYGDQTNRAGRVLANDDFLTEVRLVDELTKVCLDIQQIHNHYFGNLNQPHLENRRSEPKTSPLAISPSPSAPPSMGRETL